MMLVLFASDLHGKSVFYEQLVALIREENPALLLLGGDLLPKRGRGENLLTIQKEFIRQELGVFFDRVHEVDPSIDIGLMLGNDDLMSVRDDFSVWVDQGLFHWLERNEWITPSGWHVAGFDLVPETPFRLKDLERRDGPEDPIQYPGVHSVRSTNNGYEPTDTQDWFLSQPSVSEELAHLRLTGPPERTIFVSHTPPYNTPLDITVEGKHVGSRAVRSFVEKNQPLLALHGHIHEAFHVSGVYVTEIGKTACFNPGQMHYPALDALLVETDDPLHHHRHTAESRSPSQEGFDLLKAPFFG
jgi:Icc-related predicted phosphoesterase